MGEICETYLSVRDRLDTTHLTTTFILIALTNHHEVGSAFDRDAQAEFSKPDKGASNNELPYDIDQITRRNRIYNVNCKYCTTYFHYYMLLKLRICIEHNNHIKVNMSYVIFKTFFFTYHVMLSAFMKYIQHTQNEKKKYNLSKLLLFVTTFCCIKYKLFKVICEIKNYQSYNATVSSGLMKVLIIMYQT